MSYAQVEELAKFLRIDDTVEDTELSMLLEDASRSVDAFCGWGAPFADEAGSATARVFASDRRDLLITHPIGSATGFVLKTDTSGDGTFDVTWASSDYQLEPLNQIRSGITDFPYFLVRAVGSYEFPVCAEARVQVTAQWGWTSGVPDAVRLATMLLAKSYHDQRHTTAGVAFGEAGTAFTAGFMTPQIKSLLGPYAVRHLRMV